VADDRHGDPVDGKDGTMSSIQRQQACGLQGQTVSVALADGSRIDEATLVSVGRWRTGMLWLYSNGADVFVPFADIVDLWRPATYPARAA
jgi:hypothetical protein